MKRFLAMLLAMLLCASCALAEAAEEAETAQEQQEESSASGSWLASVLGEQKAKREETKQPAAKSSYVAQLYIDGEISSQSYLYDHEGTLEAIGKLADDEANTALLLCLNTPGGSLYEADELYHALMAYKEETGRSIYAYMEQECCSAGVYIAMAADRIAASRMTITGSVGVYMETYSEAGLYHLLGIENEYIATGENKVAGYPELTQAQREIYQALVDESFVFFKEAIASARGLTPDQMTGFTDGRLLSALQARELGLIDEIVYEDEFTQALLAGYGEDVKLRDVTPQNDFGYGYGLGSSSLLDWLDMITPDTAEDTQSLSPAPRQGGLRS